MKFPDLLVAAIQRSEIPLRFEPGAEEAVAKPIGELVLAWLEAHRPAESKSEFDRGREAVIAELVAELNGIKDVPAE